MKYGSCAASAVKRADVTLFAYDNGYKQRNLGACLMAGSGESFK